MYDEDWWIGRLVIEGSNPGYLPSPRKLESLKEFKTQKRNDGIQRFSSNEFFMKLGGVLKIIIIYSFISDLIILYLFYLLLQEDDKNKYII